MLAFFYWLFKDALFFFGMVSGGFPKPLSREEERRAISAMRAGDEKARLTLIEHNLRLVSHIVRKYTVPGYTSDDLVSVGALGLIKAVNTYKPDAGSPLSAYAARCIENAIPSPARHTRIKAAFLPISGTFAPKWKSGKRMLPPGSASPAASITAWKPAKPRPAIPKCWTGWRRCTASPSPTCWTVTAASCGPARDKPSSNCAPP